MSNYLIHLGRYRTPDSLALTRSVYYSPLYSKLMVGGTFGGQLTKEETEYLMKQPEFVKSLAYAKLTGESSCQISTPGL